MYVSFVGMCFFFYHMVSGIKLMLSVKTWWQAPLHTESSHWFPNNFCVILFSSFIDSSLFLHWVSSFLTALRWNVFAVSTTSLLSRPGSLRSTLVLSHALSEAGGLWWATACLRHDRLPQLQFAYIFCL